MKKLFAMSVLLAALLPQPARAQANFGQYLAAGNQFYAAKNYAQAVLYYRAAVQINPQSAEAYQGLGNAYDAQGLKAEALEAYQKALALQPQNAALSGLVGDLKAQTAVVSTPAGPAGTAAGPSQLVYVKIFEEFYLGGGLGADYLLRENGTFTAIGGEVVAGYSFSRMLAFQAEVDIFYYDSLGAVLLNLRFLPALKVTLDIPLIQPYVLGGGGLDTQFVMGNYGGSQTNLDYFFGGGAQYEVEPGLRLFAEVKSNYISVTDPDIETPTGVIPGETHIFNDIPVIAGVRFTL